MYAVQTSSYYLLAVATVLVSIAALGVVSYQYTLTPSSGALAAVVLGAFGTLWGIAALAVVASAASMKSSQRFGTASVLVLLTALVSLGAAIGAGVGAPAGGIYQGVSTTLFTLLAVMYLVLAFVVSEAMLQAQRGRAAVGVSLLNVQSPAPAEVPTPRRRSSPRTVSAREVRGLGEAPAVPGRLRSSKRVPRR